MYKIKHGPEDKIQCYRAQLVVKGFQQREGIDYVETFASVIKPMNYKAIFALACANIWEMHQIDVKIAFLYCLIKGEIYINQPHGFNDWTAKVYQLFKALYGLKKSPQVWYNTLVAFLKSYRMSLYNTNLSVYAKLGLIITIFVGNLLITGSSISQIKTAKAMFYAYF